VKGPLQAGQVINRTYTIEALVGTGAFGEVYLVSHRFLGQQALKVLKAGPEAGFEDVLAEARLLVDLTHPNIVRIYDANVCDEFGKPFAFMAMEYAEGRTLASLISTSIRLPDSTVVSIGMQVASALAETHARNPPLLHRDIKPSNVLIFSEVHSLPVVKVSDYGMATTLDPETRLTRSAGTIAFAPPEMAWGVTDQRGDVYSLGVTLYRALTGVHPFPLTSPEELSASRQFTHVLTNGRRSIAPPSKLLMRRSNQLDAVVMKCLEFDLFARFRDGAELLGALRDVAGSSV